MAAPGMGGRPATVGHLAVSAWGYSSKSRAISQVDGAPLPERRRGVSSPPVVAPVDVFVSYAPADEALWRELERHLQMLVRQGVIAAWSSGEVGAGADWQNVVQAHLGTARIILLLLSADFFASDRCFDVEVERALAQAKRGGRPA